MGRSYKNTKVVLYYYSIIRSLPSHTQMIPCSVCIIRYWDIAYHMAIGNDLIAELSNDCSSLGTEKDHLNS